MRSYAQLAATPPFRVSPVFPVTSLSTSAPLMPNSLTAEISSGKGSRDSSPSTNPSSNLGALKPKASTNVFSSDGSFLERFLTSKKVGGFRQLGLEQKHMNATCYRLLGRRREEKTGRSSCQVDKFLLYCFSYNFIRIYLAGNVISTLAL